MARLLILWLFVVSALSASSQGASNAPETHAESDSICISAEEFKLFQLILAYRKEHKLPPIPLSRSLSYVAQMHAKDLAENPTVYSNRCNMHSWSDKGNWKACCYTSNHKNPHCMWDKPKEMTPYKAMGYEISHGGSSGYIATPENAITGWKKSNAHNEVMINKGIWSSVKWKAIGVGIYNNYAMVWFGEEIDESAKVPKCE